MGVNKKRSSYLIAALLTVSLTLFLFILSFMPFYDGISNSYTDFRWTRVYDSDKADKDIVVIAIDQGSIQQISEKINFNWPWPRQFYGMVLDYLKKSGSDTVTFDILFDDSEIGRMDISGDESEAYFAHSIKNYGKVILGNMVDNDIPKSLTFISNIAIEFENSEKLPVETEYKYISFPIEQLRKNASVGVVKFSTDSDGICRRTPLLFKVNEKFYPQLAFATYLKSNNDKVLKYDAGSETLITEKSSFRLNNGNHVIKWHGPGTRTYKYYSFYDVFRSATQSMQNLDPVIPMEEFKNKKIVIFATAAGLSDIKPTPFSSMGPYPGGEIHTTILDNLINGANVYEIPFFLVITITMILIYLISFVYLERSLATAIMALTFILVLLLSTDYILFKNYSVQFDSVYTLIGIVLACAGSAMFKMFFEGNEKRQIRNIFSRYLSRDVINILMENPDKVDLEGSEFHGTVLFTDLQGFTTFAEDKTPQQLINVLNRYFQTVTDIVLEFKGLLDKYTGDGIMAVFGAPLPYEDHAKSACEVILTFREKGVNELISTEKGNILTRIGICSGPIVVGNLGSDKRMDYTAIGDTVNLSARLEGVNKAYGTTNMLSESTWEMVKDDYFFRELDVIRVKGKNKPIRVFTLVDRKNKITERVRNIESAFSKALKIYRERKWDEAIKGFEDVLSLSPEDLPSKAFIERCNLLKKNPDLVDKDGVFTFKTK